MKKNYPINEMHLTHIWPLHFSVSRSSSTPTFGLYSSSSSSRPRMSQSAENTPVSNQTSGVRKSLISNAGNLSYHIKLSTIGVTEPFICTHVYYEVQKQGLTISNSNNNYSYVDKYNFMMNILRLVIDDLE